MLEDLKKFELNGFLDYIWKSITFEMFIKFMIVYFLVVWIALVVWIVKDITNRTNSILLQIFSILIIIFLTPLGVFIYLLIRPGRTLFEKYYDEIEDNLDIISDFIEKKTEQKKKDKKKKD